MVGEGDWEERARENVLPMGNGDGPKEQPLENVLAMGKGDGEGSYSKNSGLQGFLNKLSQSALNDGLERMTFLSETGCSVVVADLGSSSGPNTIDNVALVIDKLRPRLPKDVEFQASFNDLPSNDFNNLFQLLSNDSRAKNFYVAGVPGSFFHRLFAKSSVHIFLSSISLQWLSKIPDAVVDKVSPAYNRGKQWLMNSSSAVAKSYQEQASLDLKSFLVARSMELVSGGLLFFTFLGRTTSQPHEPTNCSMHKFQEILDEIWSDLISEGVLTDDQRDTFNIPIYLRNIEDVREALGSCDSLFHLLTAELHTIELSWREVLAISEESDATVMSRKLAAAHKAVLNFLLEDHVGKESSEIIWQRYEKLVEKRIRALNPQDPKFTGQLCIVGLIRK